MSLHKSLMIALGAFYIGFGASPCLAYTVNKCDEIAKNEISLTADYINRRIQRIEDEFTHISKADRDELVRKWSRINITCQDEGQTGKSRDCLANQGLGGFSHGGLGNQINLCYYNIFDLGPLPVSPNPLKDYGTLCSLVGIIIHEFGHANGFAIWRTTITRILMPGTTIPST